LLTIDAHAHIFERWAGINYGAPNTSLDFGKIKNGNKIIQVMPPAFEHSNCSAENLIANMDYHGVEKAVIFSNGGYGYTNEYLFESVKKYPKRFAALALVDISKGKSAADDLGALIKYQGFKGVKYEGLSCFECSEQLKLFDPQVMPIWETLTGNDGVGVFHVARDNDIEDLKKLKELFPKMKMVVAHFGAETVFGNYGRNWEYLKNFVRQNNLVWLENSAVSIYLKEQIDFTKTIAMIEDAVQNVGAEKVIWGSDYPCMTLYATYYQMINILVEGCKKIVYNDLENIMGKNADELFFNSRRIQTWIR